jgi:hypothetical protein
VLDQLQDVRIHPACLSERGDNGADDDHLISVGLVAEVGHEAAPDLGELQPVRVGDPLTFRRRQERAALLDQLTCYFGGLSGVQPRVELGTVGPEKGEHRGQPEQLLECVRLQDELTLTVEAAAFVLLTGAARTERVTGDEADPASL